MVLNYSHSNFVGCLERHSCCMIWAMCFAEEIVLISLEKICPNHHSDVHLSTNYLYNVAMCGPIFPNDAWWAGPELGSFNYILL